jgi:hypothetical protein
MAETRIAVTNGSGRIISERVVLGMGTPNEDGEPMTLEEAQRLKSMLMPSEGLWKDIYKWPGYNEAVSDLSDGWNTADAMLGLIPYGFPDSLLRAAVLYKPVEVMPAQPDQDKPPTERAKRLADECYTLINTIRNPKTSVSQSFYAVLWEYLSKCHHGYSVVEKFWRMETTGKLKGNWVLRRLVPRHPSDIGFDLDRNTLEPLHITRKFAPDGEQQFLQADRRVPVEKFVLATFKPFRNLPYGRGHFRDCYNPATFISGLYRLWGRAQEKTGIPFPSIVSNSNKAEVMEAQRELTDSQKQGYGIVFPPGVDPKWVNAVQGVSDGFERAVMHQCMQIVLLILFQTLTTSADGKSAYALGQVHQATQEFALAHVRQMTEWNFTNQLFADYVRYNHGEEAMVDTPYVYLGLWGLAELNLLADYLQKFFTMGILNAQEDNDWLRKVAKLRPGMPPDPLDTLPVGGNPQPGGASE